MKLVKTITWGIVWFSLSLSLFAAPLHPGAHWDYSSGPTGPQGWGDLSPDYITCRDGQNQSPIDIGVATPGAKEPINFRYEQLPLNIINNGHTIQLDNSAQNAIQIGEQNYLLRQLHFHGPSEHTIAGKPYPMEMHLVHQNAQGQLAVIGVLFAEGAHNSALDAFWADLPRNVNAKQSFNRLIDLPTLLPENRSYYQYPGSLTTPPCTEGVSWYVLSTPLSISRAQLDAFNAVMTSNARPTQPLNQRSLVHVNLPNSPQDVAGIPWGVTLVGAVVAAGAIIVATTYAMTPEVVPPAPAILATPIKAVVDMVFPTLGIGY